MANDSPLIDHNGIQNSEIPTAQIVEPKTRSFSSLTTYQLFLLATWTLVADITLFRTLGFAGPAVWFAIVPVFFWGKSASRVKRLPLLIATALLLLVALRLVWLGSVVNVISGLVLTIAIALASNDRVPRVVEGVVFAMRVCVDGCLRIGGYRSDQNDPAARRSLDQSGHTGKEGERIDPSIYALGWIFPVIAICVFGAIFVFANPDLFRWVSERLASVWDISLAWIGGLSPLEIPFCLAAFVFRRRNVVARANDPQIWSRSFDCPSRG